jgi:hypothetical protein
MIFVSKLLQFTPSIISESVHPFQSQTFASYDSRIHKIDILKNLILTCEIINDYNHFFFFFNVSQRHIKLMLYSSHAWWWTDTSEHYIEHLPSVQVKPRLPKPGRVGWGVKSCGVYFCVSQHNFVILQNIFILRYR